MGRSHRPETTAMEVRVAIPQILLLALGVLVVVVEIRAHRGPRPKRPEVVAAALDRARRRALNAQVVSDPTRPYGDDGSTKTKAPSS